MDNHRKEIRPAATLLIVREVQVGIEVLALKRSENMRFLPGFIAFPGGALSEIDQVIAHNQLVGTLSASEQDDDPKYAVAAIRECAEEIGWLCDIKGRNGEVRDRTLERTEQSDLLKSEATFPEILSDNVIDANALRFVGRWVTPEGMPARFDTRFFLYVAHHLDFTPQIHRSELSWAKWVNPTDLLSAVERGEEQAVPPTRAMLHALSQMPNLKACWEGLCVPGPGAEPKQESESI